jgi:hypothetical protein
MADFLFEKALIEMDTVSILVREGLYVHHPGLNRF